MIAHIRLAILIWFILVPMVAAMVLCILKARGNWPVYLFWIPSFMALCVAVLTELAFLIVAALLLCAYVVPLLFRLDAEKKRELREADKKRELDKIAINDL